jgi:hypothetical protein
VSDDAPPAAASAQDAGASGQVLESPAYPPLLRVLSVVIVVDVIGFALWSLPALRSASWSASGFALLSLAGIGVLWMGCWIVCSRTRLEGDVLSQTWLWNRRAHARDVTQLKLVHWRPLERVIAPRLLVRRRNGAIAWFHSADARLLAAFSERVARQAGQPPLRS